MQLSKSIHVIIFVIMSFILLTGCSSHAAPDNFEPIIEPLETVEITRTEATISARVHKRGSTDLTYLTFHYGENENINQEIHLNDPTLEVQTYRIQGLKAGTSYSWYVEGGTVTATLRSETKNFTTVPNERPKVSSLVALSTGPIGIIVAFDITDDGGEPVLEAGCEVTDNSTNKTDRLYLAADDLTGGSHRLHIGGLRPDTHYTITPFASNSAGETMGQSLAHTTRNTIVLDKAGDLPQLFKNSPKVELEKLTISGYMDGDDFKFLRLLLGAPTSPTEGQIESLVTEVDLSDAHITEGGSSYDGSRFTNTDEFSTGLMADCVNLRKILLPTSATVLARDAFAHCLLLEKLTISAEIKSVLPSSECQALQAIEVSDANVNFSAIDGVLFNSDGSEILWFPLGKTGEYVLPSTITMIGENAFLGTSITSLEIPPSVTSISRGAFAGSSLCEISLPDNITNISEGMFQNCTNLTILRLGKGTEFIGNYAFDGTDIKNLYLGTSIPPFTNVDAFTNRTYSITENCTLYVPYGCKAMYRSHSKWGHFCKIEEF